MSIISVILYFFNEPNYSTVGTSFEEVHDLHSVASFIFDTCIYVYKYACVDERGHVYKESWSRGSHKPN